MIKYKYSILTLLLAWTIVIAPACKTSDNEQDNEQDNDTSKCVDGIYTNSNACSTICESIHSQEDCNNTKLPTPKESEEFMFYGHSCRWYNAVEVNLNSTSKCVFGEKRGSCGYAAHGDIDCGGTGMLCDEKWIGEYQYGAGYYVEDNKIFMYVDTCVASVSGVFRQCQNPSDAIDECVCGCEMDAGVNYD